MQLSWFRAPAGADPGSTNLCFHAIDAQVVHGRAGEVAVEHGGTEIDYATLLERVAALGGAMRGVGVTPGAVVAMSLEDPLDQLLAVLACLRIGAVGLRLPVADPTVVIDLHRPTLVFSDRALEYAAHTPSVAFLRGVEPEDDTRDLDWDLALRVGRTDPAGAEPVAGDTTAYIIDRAVAVGEVPDDDSTIARLLDDLAQGRPLRLETTTEGSR